MKVLYRTSATAYGARAGRAVSDDDRLDVQLSLPKELGGDGGDGTNPEQLFAAGYASCFFSAMKIAAAKSGVSLDGTEITAHVDLVKPEDVHGLRLAVELVAKIPGQDASVVQGLMDATHQICPYSYALRGDATVTLTPAS